MKSVRSNSSLAVAAAGFFGFAVLISGVWHPKVPAGGLTQVGRTASVTFEDGTVIDLTESENDQDILKKRRMRGWNGHEYKRLFVMADGEEIDLGDAQPAFAANSEELSTGDRLLLAANTTDMPVDALHGANRRAMLAHLQSDDRTHNLAGKVDAKDGVATDSIDGKDRAYIDFKDATEQPVFALTADQSPTTDERFDMILLGGGDGGGSDLASMRVATGLNTPGSGGGGNVTVPPIGIAVPEPSALLWVGVASVAGLGLKAWRRRMVAA